MDAVAKLPRLPHETRRLSCDHDEGVEATRDAIAAILKSSSSFLTLSQHAVVDEHRLGHDLGRVVGVAELRREEQSKRIVPGDGLVAQFY